jgi:Na+-transporting methylmalonyl-CoA/oxaloacetate decarboxylase gamma subunit
MPVSKLIDKEVCKLYNIDVSSLMTGGIPNLPSSYKCQIIVNSIESIKRNMRLDARHIMTTLSVIELILAVTIIGLAGIAIVAAFASLLVQTISATTDVMTETVGEEEEALNTTSTSANNNNVSNALLGNLFLTGEDKLTNFNPINETYIEVSYVGNRTIMPPDATTTAATINATETGNLTLNLQPNGITFVEGQSLLVTEGDSNNGAAEQENATAVLVDLNGVRPDDPRSSTGVAFFSTNSTGQLAFLDNMVAIYQVKASPAGTAIGMWEWKGADLPFGNEGDDGTAIIGNQTTTTTIPDTLQERG